MDEQFALDAIEKQVVHQNARFVLPANAHILLFDHHFSVSSVCSSGSFSFANCIFTFSSPTKI